MAVVPLQIKVDGNGSEIFLHTTDSGSKVRSQAFALADDSLSVHVTVFRDNQRHDICIFLDKDEASRLVEAIQSAAK